MTNKQKIAIAIGSGLLGAYAIIFVYQRIQRKKADESNVPLDNALEILKEKSTIETPDFTAEDSIPQIPNPDDSMLNDTGYIPDSNLTELQQWDLTSGMGDY
jgi:hypothetical protein